jgi:hypothetical protein
VAPKPPRKRSNNLLPCSGAVLGCGCMCVQCNSAQLVIQGGHCVCTPVLLDWDARELVEIEAAKWLPAHTTGLGATGTLLSNL